MMSSDRVRAPEGASEERQLLAHAFEPKRMRFSRLPDREFDALLATLLRSIVLRELRGFQPLEVFLRERGKEFGPLPDDLELLTSGFAEFEPRMKTQVQGICREVTAYEQVFGRHETDEETTDWKVQNEWGEGSYVKRGWVKDLLVMRPPNYSHAYDNLVEVEYRYTKVPTKNQFTINHVHLRHVHPELFREYFGYHACHIVQYMIWEISSIYSRTQNELASKATYMQQQHEFWERLSSCISE